MEKSNESKLEKEVKSSLLQKLKKIGYVLLIIPVLSAVGYGVCDSIRSDKESAKYQRIGRLFQQGYNKDEIDSIINENRIFLPVKDKEEWIKYWRERGEEVNEEQYNTYLKAWNEGIGGIHKDGLGNYYIIK